MVSVHVCQVSSFCSLHFKRNKQRHTKKAKMGNLDSIGLEHCIGTQDFLLQKNAQFSIISTGILTLPRVRYAAAGQGRIPGRSRKYSDRGQEVTVGIWWSRILTAVGNVYGRWALDPVPTPMISGPHIPDPPLGSSLIPHPLVPLSSLTPQSLPDPLLACTFS